jgi:formate-dependent nitrite reductase membrane component NrfD
VLYLLFILICICSFYTGYILSGKKKIDWIGIIGFCMLICAIVHLIIDLDRPRRGIITLMQTNESIVELREMFLNRQIVSFAPA